MLNTSLHGALKPSRADSKGVNTKSERRRWAAQLGHSCRTAARTAARAGCGGGRQRWQGAAAGLARPEEDVSHAAVKDTVEGERTPAGGSAEGPASASAEESSAKQGCTFYFLLVYG